MLKRTKTFLTARATVLVLILLLTAGMIAAVVVPQTGPSAASARAGAPLPSLVERLGLTHVFSSWWFAAPAIVFVVSLVLSSFDQLRACRARMRRLPAEGSGMPCASSRERIEEVLAREGYRRLAQGPGGTRYVKFWLGYWGSALLHLGMTCSALFALTYALTENRVSVQAVSGIGVSAGQSAGVEGRGLLARPLPLPARMTLFTVEPEFGDDDHLEDVASRWVFTDDEGTSRDVRVGVNDYQHYRGLVVYQLTRFGNAFQLELRNGPGGDLDLTLPLPMPARRDVAGYGKFQVDGGRLRLDAKYYANADRSRLVPADPRLFLRLYDGERLLEETALSSGQVARLGPYDVKLAAVGWWTELLFEGSLGTAGIFTGFALLLCGGLLSFFTVPREAIVRTTPAGCTVDWRAARFLELYREERDRILSRCGGEAGR
jgi:hypothetical protein